MKNEAIELLVITEGQDVDGFPIRTEHSTDCFADVQSAKRSEFYQAASVGINVQMVVVVNYDDYKSAYFENIKPNRVRVDGELFRILRTYRKKTSGEIELTLVEGERNG